MSKVLIEVLVIILIAGSYLILYSAVRVSAIADQRIAEIQKREQWAFEIFPDGVIKYYAYPRAGRKVLDKDKVQIDASRVIAFYDADGENSFWCVWTD